MRKAVRLFANSLGQLASVTDPDGVETLYAYNTFGEREFTAINLDNDDEFDYGSDRVEKHTTDIVNSGSIDSALGIAMEEKRYVYLSGSSNPTLISARYSAGSGLKTRSESYPRGAGDPQVTEWVKEITGIGSGLSGGALRETTTWPDSTKTIITYDLWRAATEEQKDRTKGKHVTCKGR